MRAVATGAKRPRVCVGEERVKHLHGRGWNKADVVTERTNPVVTRGCCFDLCPRTRVDRHRIHPFKKERLDRKDLLIVCRGE